MMLEFLETDLFTRQITGRLFDALQGALSIDSEAGDLIPGTGGLRNLRWQESLAARETLAAATCRLGVRMKKQLFDQLVESIRDAGKIHRGEKPPSRRFVFEPADIRAIRERLHKSQSEFARMIGVTVSTLQNWEQGRREPQGPARALLVVVSKAPEVVAKALASATRRGA